MTNEEELLELKSYPKLLLKESTVQGVTYQCLQDGKHNGLEWMVSIYAVEGGLFHGTVQICRNQKYENFLVVGFQLSNTVEGTQALLNGLILCENYRH